MEALASNTVVQVPGDDSSEGSGSVATSRARMTVTWMQLPQAAAALAGRGAAAG